MSEFTSGFWDYYVAIVSIVSLLACALFLKSQSKVRAKLDEHGQPQTTDHVWDETLREFQQPMPRWWVMLFYLTVVFAFGYLPRGRSMLETIQKLPQGHAMSYEVRTNRLTTWPYWSLPEPPADEPMRRLA